jgi:very-short-patch-repair endonuclease
MREEMRSHQRLASLATRQHGIVSSRQLQRLGYSKSAIGRAVARAHLHRIHRGVYAVGHADLSVHGHCLAAVAACGSDALLSHSSAGWLWGLLSQCDKPIQVSVPRRGHARLSICAHHAPALSGEDRAFRERIPVTALPRTLLDLAATIPCHRLDRAVERSEQLGLFDLLAIDSLLARITGHRGAGRLRSALRAYRDPAFTRSSLERQFLDLVRSAGLPTPSANMFIAGFEIDMYWPLERFAVELDGYEHHRNRVAFERDRLRQEELKLAGIEMIRVTAARIAREPELVMERLATLLARRRGELRWRRNTQLALAPRQR